MKNILLNGYERYFVNFARNLKRHGFDIKYWCARHALYDEYGDEFGKTIFHDHYEMIKGHRAKLFNKDLIPPICPTITKNLLFDEKIAFSMFERNATHCKNFSYKERYELINRMIEYWTYVCKREDIQCVIFSEEPHQVGDYLLYAVCRELNIKTLIFIRTVFPALIFPVNSFEEGSVDIARSYASLLKSSQKTRQCPSKAVQAYLNTLRGDYEGVIAVHLHDQIAEIKKMGFSKTSAIQDKTKESAVLGKLPFFKWKDWILRGKYIFDFSGKSFHSDQKQLLRSFHNSNLTYIEHLFLKYKSTVDKKRMLKFYNKISHVPELKEPYIFFALQYEPEKTTCPLGGVYSDQFLAIRTLHSYLPKGWRILVKEHPSQFSKLFARYGENYRRKSFYRNIQALSNVELVSMSINPFILIDHANAVASVTANTCWEAVVRGKPAITFGHPWFKGCAGVFPAYTHALLAFAISEISKGFEVKKSDVNLFSYVVETTATRGGIGGGSWTNFTGVSDDENGLAHFETAIKFIESH